ncbi:TetR family transcriptional regulator [Leucobacter triazinivorans]|uniref:TetR/AcrR family transcriptional regulator n=1 Tax=Leucobacter triazinivorans TaxID=1784719 RepID=A0A4P6KHD2_9MICO|nr:TetR/AcrR family transcriptional regulator [Leucobacter triazinivorans]QBE49762.1 TetR/AcrR family transcriptional regulator [Leucobacter triazinivorans]
MARPSVADERREQIIDATLRTISERGISGTTLDRIADTAGMSRGHVRHFAGNRDRLLLDAARAFYADETGSPAILPSGVDDLEGALDFLFGEEFASSSAENAIVLAFVELARTDQDIAATLAAAYGSTRSRLAACIAAAKPAASPAAREAAAQGVLTAALGNVFIGDFDRDPARTSLTRTAVDALLAAL